MKLKYILILTSLSISCNAAIVTANSGSFVDVSNACVSAGYGGTVWIPPGTNNWGGQLTDQGVNLYGSNSCSITFTNANSFGLYVQSLGTFTTISNIIFDSAINSPTAALIGIDGSNVCFRVTGCTVMHVSQPGLECVKIDTGLYDSENWNGPWGVIDNCNFNLPDQSQPYNIINTHANGYFNNGTSGYGWFLPMTWGTTNTVDVESCNFSVGASSTTGTQAAIEAFGGARICLRYCNFTNVVESTHGPASGTPGFTVGTLQMEMYNNLFVFNNPNVQWTYLYCQRGGSAMLFSNTWLNFQYFGNVTAVMQFRAECAESGNPEACSPPTTYPANYPMGEQVGQGMIGTNSQGYQPVYIYANNYPNTYNNSQFRFELGIDGPSGLFIQQGRDIYTNTVAPGYTPLVFPSPLIGQPNIAPVTPPTPAAIITGVKF